MRRGPRQLDHARGNREEGERQREKRTSVDASEERMGGRVRAGESVSLQRQPQVSIDMSRLLCDCARVAECMQQTVRARRSIDAEAGAKLTAIKSANSDGHQVAQHSRKSEGEEQPQRGATVTTVVSWCRTVRGEIRRTTVGATAAVDLLAIAAARGRRRRRRAGTALSVSGRRGRHVAALASGGGRRGRGRHA